MTPEQLHHIISILQSGEELSPEWARIIFPPQKREYELVYYEKEREEDILANIIAVPLQPVRTFGRNGIEWNNKLIFGDNLQVMKNLLDEKKAGRLCNADGTPGIRLVYIDPPFSTKQEFRGSQDQKAYQDKVAGAAFIEFLRKRLIIIRELLSSDGVVYVHLDWRKCHYIKAILDEVFGEGNFRNEIIWQRLSARSDSKTFNHIHETVFFYSKSGTFNFNTQYSGYSEEYIEKFYRYKDEDGRLYSIGDLTARGLRNGESGLPWRGVDPAKLGNHWKVKVSTLDELDRQGKIYWPPNGSVPRLKQYLDERLGRPLQSIWQDISPVQHASKENANYPSQKPEELLSRIIGSSSNPGDIVMDAFAGSGTTLAVAEKLGRRWIGIDSGKLSIYTIQRRLLNLKTEIGNKGKALKVKPFTLYNAGLYDFSRLKELTWSAWRSFALILFQCRDDPHTIGGINFDGTLKGASVLVFNHQELQGARVTEDTVYSLHEAVGTLIGSRMFIIAPSLSFDFQQDYLELGGVRYYALRIPYSIIHELHNQEFMALTQPTDEMAVNDTVDAVGFDFIRTPELEYTVGIDTSERLFNEAYIQINTFMSEAIVREPLRKRGNRETLSMVMLDYDFDTKSDVFEFDDVFYADDIEKRGWEVRFPEDSLGANIMAIFVDIYGNEARELIPKNQFYGIPAGMVNKAKESKARKRKVRKNDSAK